MVHKSIVDNNTDKDRIPVDNIDELKDALMPSQSPYIIFLAPQILKSTPYSIELSSDNLLIICTITTKIIQKLVQSQGPKMSDLIWKMAGQLRFNVKITLDLSLKIT